MQFFKSSQFRLDYYILPIIFFMITLYFSFHLIQGERGIFRLFEVNEQLTSAADILQKTSREKLALEHKILALSKHNLNMDLLDEVTRQELGFCKPSEYVIMTE